MAGRSCLAAGAREATARGTICRTPTFSSCTTATAKLLGHQRRGGMGRQKALHRRRARLFNASRRRWRPWGTDRRRCSAAKYRTFSCPCRRRGCSTPGALRALTKRRTAAARCAPRAHSRASRARHSHLLASARASRPRCARGPRPTRAASFARLATVTTVHALLISPRKIQLFAHATWEHGGSVASTTVPRKAG